MNPFDMIIVAVVSVCLIRGIFIGLIREVFSIIGVFTGFYAAYTYYPQTVNLLKGWWTDVAYLNIASFLIIFCGVFIVVSVLGIVIKYLMNLAFLGWFDRIAGAAFGLFKGILIVSILLLILTAFLPKGAKVVRNSVLSRHVAFITERMSRVVSRDMKQQFNANIGEFRKGWKIR